VGSLVDQVKSGRLFLQKMKDIAKLRNNSVAIADLAKVKTPFENDEQLFLDLK
jgi:hypothetical protein